MVEINCIKNAKNKNRHLTWGGPQIVVRTDTFTEKSRDDVLDSDWLISDNLVALKVAPNDK